MLARLAFQDRSRLRLCEAPDAAFVLEALRTTQAHEPDFEQRLKQATSGFEPNPLWKSWMTHVHGERLRQIADDLAKSATRSEPKEAAAGPPNVRPAQKKATAK